ncbi:K02A2.6-like [Cordylochernes scorpioides]|uniref:K02A2.6-like n=1 Tax=Cordylochernes scorpioides TaxID=51811 RepID=A0ABY6KYR6_9ARAC|nr:K02A2.6-like [Cordylochernes scorpioides]
MPFGLCNAPATFKRNMENMLGNLRWQICLCYLYDVIIYSPDFQRTSKDSKLFLDVFNPRDITSKLSEIFLGPQSVSFTWTERQEEAFQTLKIALLSPPILGHFNPNAPTYIHTDASNIGIDGTLAKTSVVISYLSRTLSKAEQNYSTTEKECLAVIWSMSKLRPYLYGRHFKIVANYHALCWLKNLKDPTGRLARWALNIQEYDFILPPNLPFKRIGIDFVGPLPSTKNRKKWIIVLTDYYTSYAETRAVSEATVKEVSKFLLEDIFLRHGVP